MGEGEKRGKTSPSLPYFLPVLRLSSKFLRCFLFAGKCDVPLGLEDGRIPNPMFRASSSYNYYCTARNARLHQRRAGRNGGAWCSRARNNKQWLQVDFGTDTVVTRVSTQGRHNSDQWVTSYYVSFSSRGQRFITYKEGRKTKVCHVQRWIDARFPIQCDTATIFTDLRYRYC